jgi:tetratricopeptide (TPR) repeat protein
MAEVWSAVHSKEMLRVALKVLSGGKEHLELNTQAIGREIRSVARLEHPGIVRILDAGIISAESAEASGGQLEVESPFFAMELAESGTLREAMPLADWSSLRAVLIAILEALAHSHARGVIHRDLKPENILLFPEAPPGSRTRLTDFGIAGHLNSSQASLTPQAVILDFCTMVYAPPEQLLGKKHLLGPSSDLYSLGCLAAELADGAQPHEGATLIEVINRQLDGWKPRFSFMFPVPEGFDCWVTTLLSCSLAERFRHAADALEALLELSPPIATSTLRIARSVAVQGDALSAPTQQFPEDGVPTARTEPFVSGKLEAVHLLNPWRPPQGLAARAAPAVPPHWASETSWVERPQLVGAGLTLFPVRRLPFVGRELERELLRKALGEVVSSGCARTIVVQGAAGTGKTSLTEWLGERISQLGCAWALRVKHTRFGNPKDGMGAALWRSQGLSQATREDKAEALRQFTEGLGLRSSPEALVQSLSPTDAADPRNRQRGHASAATETVTEICSTLSRRRPLVLLVDDAHWGWDSLQTVAALLSKAEEADAPILIVLCVREDLLRERPMETTALERILQHPRTTSLQLDELKEDECRELVAQLLPFTDEVIDYVTTRSDGVPAHAVQLVTAWVEQGLVERTEEGFTIPSRYRSDLPSTIHSAFQDRVERLLAPLSPDARIVLELLVVLGSDSDEPTLSALAESSRVEVEAEFLTRLEEAGLAHFDGNRWSLRWRMLTESVEQAARQAGRWKQHHLNAGELFAARVESGLLRSLSAAGRHYVVAEQWEVGIPLLLRAAQHERFLRLPNRGIELLDSCDEAIRRAGPAAPGSARAESLGLRSNLRKLAGKPNSDWIGLAEESERLARAGNYPKALAEALRQRAIWLREQRRYEEGIEVVEEYLSLFKTHRDPQGSVEATIQKAKMLKHAGRVEEALAWAKIAVDVADRDGETADRVNTRVALLEVHFSRGDLAEAQRLVEELHSNVEDPSVPIEIRFQILSWTGSVEFLVGNYEPGRQAFRAAVKAGRTTLSTSLWFRALAAFAEAEKSAGFLKRARDLFEQAEAACTFTGESPRVMMMRVNRALLDVQAGDYIAAARRFGSIEFPAGQTRNPVYDIVEEFIGFFSAQAKGSWEQAERHLLDARTALREGHFIDRDFAVLLEQAGEICLHAGRFDLARAVLDEAITLWSRTGGTPEDLRRCRKMRPLDDKET